MSEKFQGIFYKFIIGIIIGIIFGLSYILIRFDFSILAFCDSFLLTGFFVFIVSLCSFVNNEGFFDMISYGFQQMPYMLHIQKIKKYEDLVDYKDQKSNKRSGNKLAPIGYILSSVLFLLIGLILYLIIKF